MSSADTQPVFLYDHPVSSYAQKIRIALREKGIPFNAAIPEAIKTGKPEAQFSSANPRLEVPTLIDGDVQILDSTIILEYIEDKWPEPALLPKSPADRARARMIEEICDTHYEAVNWGYGELLWFKRAEGEMQEKLTAEVKRQTRTCLDWLTEKLGEKDYLVGDQFGWADLSAAAVVNRSRFYGHGPSDEEPLGRWLKRIGERASVRETFVEFNEGAAKLFAMADAYTSGERKREYRDHRLEWMIKSGGIEVVLEGLKKKNIRFAWP